MSETVLRRAAAQMRAERMDCGGLASGWSPEVADAVADWLEQVADRAVTAEGYAPWTAELTSALTVASAYLIPPERRRVVRSEVTA